MARKAFKTAEELRAGNARRQREYQQRKRARREAGQLAGQGKLEPVPLDTLVTGDLTIKPKARRKKPVEVELEL